MVVFYSGVVGDGCFVSGDDIYGGIGHGGGVDEFCSRGGIHGCNCRSESLSKEYNCLACCSYLR